MLRVCLKIDFKSSHFDSHDTDHYTFQKIFILVHNNINSNESYITISDNNNNFYFIFRSFIAEDVKKNTTKQELSILFEASKERYSSSSGSSNSKTQGSVCTAANLSAQMAQQEVMEKLAQISINKSGEFFHRLIVKSVNK